jgi:hypothetical protein
MRGGGLKDGHCGPADQVPIAGWLAAGRSGSRSGVAGGLPQLRQEHLGCMQGAELMGLHPAFQGADSMVRKLIGKGRMTWET